MPTEPTPIRIPFPSDGDLSLRVAVGACRVKVEPGAESWVEGTYTDKSGRIPLQVDEAGSSVTIRQRHQFESIVGLFEEGAPRLDLALGTSRSFALVVDGGANEVELDLSGVPLTRLEIKHGAGQVSLGFSAPNPVRMSSMRFAGGAGSFDARGLGHAAFDEMVAEGGAARFALDFSGELTADCSARVNTGASSVSITVPPSTPASVSARTVLGTLDVSGEVVTRDGVYWTRPGADGVTPLLAIQAEVAVGRLTLHVV